jgi:predicted kinase
VYAAARDDFDLYGVLDYYVGYRAAVRSKVAALAAADGELPAAQRSAARASALAHLALTESALAVPLRGRAIATCGSIGTGKSSAAAELADGCAGVVVATDRVRKAARPQERVTAPWGEGQYSPGARAAVYGAVLERAEPVVRSGRTAVLDATWSSAAQRAELCRWGEALGIDVWLLELVCPAAEVRRRLERRAAAGHDPSDAGPELLDHSRASFEPPEEWPADRRARVDTSAPDWRARVRALAKIWCG